ncbi:archaetidylserine decarboxylase [Alicyclobacillus sp. ALC3]|uniref:archaetidylserine decarboxylase n=1 Tax=Alicyclobacillus sp. ALC3 TaxID=2796143 RepID=UPI002378A6EE|nr:archaetidylserine decarboxylase [Alicyclobacillus sp. ALC3]WDL97404.1 phosphatidylserine decarboxylase [Alicyclobacillus sp. ALC3]
MRKFALQVLPKRALTAVVGWFSGTSLSRMLIPWYSRHYQIRIEDAEYCADAYRSLRDFFTRRLRSDVRPIESVGLLAPVDGVVSEVGIVSAGLLLQAKGVTYTLSALLADAKDAATFEGGLYFTFYLSPRDYHRIHMPLDGTVTSWRYIPGTLYPVNPLGVQLIPGLFAKNERLVSNVDTDQGAVAIVKVGATVVGRIRTVYGPPVQAPRRRAVQQGELNLCLQRGDELGWFEMGSTVIVVVSSRLSLKPLVKRGDAVMMGQTVAVRAETE